MPDEARTVSAAELARLLNLDSTRRVQQLAADEGMPKASRGRYDAQKCVLWYIRYLQRCLERRQAEYGNNDFEAFRSRKMAADAELAELEVARVRGEQIALGDVEAKMRSIAITIRSQLMSVPGRYSARTVGLASLPESQRTWDGAIRDILAELKDGAATA